MIRLGIKERILEDGRRHPGLAQRWLDRDDGKT